MKTRTICCIALAVVLIGTGSSFAVPFSTTNNYGGLEVGFNSKNTEDGFYSSVFPQMVAFDPLLSSFNSATLSITYSNVSNGNGEVWAAWGSNTGGVPTPGTTHDYFSLGRLTGGSNNTQYTAGFALSGSQLPTVPPGGLETWTLYLAFRETTTGEDRFNLYTINLSGDYNQVPVQNPVPEPGTILLLGSGLVGLAGSKLRKKVRG